MAWLEQQRKQQVFDAPPAPPPSIMQTQSDTSSAISRYRYIGRGLIGTGGNKLTRGGRLLALANKE